MTREKGLYKNGSRWWLRVRAPSGLVAPRSTGTEDLRLANRIAGMVVELREHRAQWEWVEAAARGDLSLAELYDHRAAGTLHSLREKQETAKQAAADADAEPWVGKWFTEILARQDISERQRDDNVRFVRALIPAGVVFPRSQFTAETVRAALAGLTTPSGAPAESSTRRRYFDAWRRFYRYAKRRVPLVGDDPFEDLIEMQDAPRNNPPRLKSWTHAETLRCLDAMPPGEFRVAMTLAFGSGMELSALAALQDSDVQPGRMVRARGTKNEFRTRLVFVDRWAWEATTLQFALGIVGGPLFPNIGEDGKYLRAAFYRAQVSAKLCPEPPRSRHGKPLWGQVDVHTIHDARHTYCGVRLLGEDGEPRQSLKFCANQLGHADEQMVMQIYGKLRIADRLREIELRESFEAGQKSQLEVA